MGLEKDQLLNLAIGLQSQGFAPRSSGSSFDFLASHGCVTAALYFLIPKNMSKKSNRQTSDRICDCNTYFWATYKYTSYADWNYDDENPESSTLDQRHPICADEERIICVACRCEYSSEDFE